MSYNSTNSPQSAAGITGGLPNSFGLKLEITIFASLALWNAVELLVLVLLTFRRYHGLYFWSLVVSSAGLIPYTIGFLLKYFTTVEASTNWIGLLLLTVGWWSMVTGQAVVLWSRLHLVVNGKTGQRVLRWTAGMIIVDALILHVPTSVLTWLDNYATHPQRYVRVFDVFEKLQMTGFFVQEMILSSIYLIAISRILRTSLKDNTRRLLYQLFAINVFIMLGDISLLAIEYANLYIQETMWKPVLYSLKLKLEFAVLGKLVKFVGGNQTTDEKRPSVAFATEPRGNSLANNDIADFVDVTRITSDVSHAHQKGSRPSRKEGRSPEDLEDSLDLDLARFEHSHDATLKEDHL